MFMESTSTCIGTLNVGETSQIMNKGVVGEKTSSSYMFDPTLKMKVLP
jgi:hypothetical protein